MQLSPTWNIFRHAAKQAYDRAAPGQEWACAGSIDERSIAGNKAYYSYIKFDRYRNVLPAQTTFGRIPPRLSSRTKREVKTRRRERDVQRTFTPSVGQRLSSA